MALSQGFFFQSLSLGSNFTPSFSLSFHFELWKDGDTLIRPDYCKSLMKRPSWGQDRQITYTILIEVLFGWVVIVSEAMRRVIDNSVPVSPKE